jgi:hypothetical protein
VLPNVIEKSVRTMIVHGLLVRVRLSSMAICVVTLVQDYILIAEGTRIAIQCVCARRRRRMCADPAPAGT